MSYGENKFHSFTYNGLNSLDFGVYIRKAGTYNSGARSVTEYNVPGRSGAIIIDNGNFENFKVTYECRLLPKKDKYADFARQTDDIKNWLYADTGNYHSLTDSYGKSHQAAFTSALDFTEVKKGTLDVAIAFNCKPDF